MHTHNNYIWHNASNTQQAEPIKFFEPDSLGDIIRVVKLARQNGLEVRAVGTGISTNSLGISDGYLVCMKRINKVVKLREEYLQKHVRKLNLFQAEAGMTLGTLHKTLDTYGLCLGQSGTHSQQTLGGAITTAAHGSSLESGGLQDKVRSLLMITHQGEVVRIEPSKGLMSPRAYRLAGVRLIQDDDFFFSTLVSLGSFGIVYSYILELEDTHFLQESREFCQWQELRTRLLSGSLLTEKHVGLHPYQSVSIEINPYRNQQQSHSCMINRQRKIMSLPKSTLKKSLRTLQTNINNWVSKLATIPAVGEKLIRWFPGQTPRLLESGLQIKQFFLKEDKSWKILESKRKWDPLSVYSTEFAFDLAQPLRLVKALEELFEQVQQMAHEQGEYQSLPFQLHFVRQSPAYLAPEYQREVCYLETPLLHKSKKGQHLLKHYQQTMFKAGGIPAWGKVNDILLSDPARLKQLYPRLATWEKVFHYFNPDGCFTNTFIKDLQLGHLTTDKRKAA